MAFIKMNSLRLDTDCVEGYYPKEDVVDGKVHFQIHILRRNVSEVFMLTFINEQARNDCLAHLDFILKPN